MVWRLLGHVDLFRVADDPDRVYRINSMALLKDTVDLFVVGEDFYRGSTKKYLGNGWCDFSALGRKQVTSFFGTSVDLGTIWYLTHKVDESGLRSFEECRRQQMWLRNQGPNVACIIIDDHRTEASRHNIPTNGEWSHYATENAAITALARAQLAPNAMLIAAEYEDRPEIQSFLHQKYDGEEILLVPPDLPQNALSTSVSLLHEDLENAHYRTDVRFPGTNTSGRRRLQAKSSGYTK
jgi:hypothetical protein